MQAFQIRLMHGLQTSGQTAFYIDYDDIGDLAVLNGLAAWLGVPARLAQVDDTLKKQNPAEIADKVVNPAEMERPWPGLIGSTCRAPRILNRAARPRFPALWRSKGRG